MSNRLRQNLPLAAGILLLLICLFLAYLAMRSVAVYPPAPLWQTVCLAVPAALALAGGVLLVSRRPMSTELRAILIAVLIAALGLEFMLLIPGKVKEDQMNEALAEYVGMELLSENAELPERTRFVFYLMDSEHFLIPAWPDYPRRTTDPERVKVVVAYHDLQEDSAVELQIIRLDSWALIDAVTLDVGDAKSVPESEAVQEYLNAFLRSNAQSSEEE